jgi:hypothetical protein
VRCWLLSVTAGVLQVLCTRPAVLAGIPGAWAFTSAEDAETIEVWLRALKELLLKENPHWKPSCFVVDCCKKLNKALR